MRDKERAYWMRLAAHCFATAIWMFALALFFSSMHMCPIPSWIDVSHGGDGSRLGCSIFVAVLGTLLWEVFEYGEE